MIADPILEIVAIDENVPDGNDLESLASVIDVDEMSDTAPPVFVYNEDDVFGYEIDDWLHPDFYICLRLFSAFCSIFQWLTTTMVQLVQLVQNRRLF